jgi:signal transduction histidine kinase
VVKLFPVSDTGVGLPTENLDRIFSVFYTTKAQGSGMGLAISRSIVESHGGRLWATANDGHGTTFHFSLPTPGDGVNFDYLKMFFRAFVVRPSPHKSCPFFIWL